MAKLMKTKKWTFSLTLLVAIAGATLLGGFFGNRLFGSPMQNDGLTKRLKEYTDLLSAVTANSAEDIGSDKFVYSSIDGMLRNLDPHTSFLEPKEYSDMQDRQKGTFYGLGILVTKRNDQVTVITPLEGTPASRLGIRAGDVISEVEGTATDDLSLDEVVKRLKGPKGTTVHIKIMRIGMKEADSSYDRARRDPDELDLQRSDAPSWRRLHPHQGLHRPRPCASSTKRSRSCSSRGCRSSSSTCA